MSKYLKRSEIDALLNRRERKVIDPKEVMILQEAISEEENRLGIPHGSLSFEAIEVLKKKIGLEHVVLVNTKDL